MQKLGRIKGGREKRGKYSWNKMKTLIMSIPSTLGMFQVDGRWELERNKGKSKITRMLDCNFSMKI